MTGKYWMVHRPGLGGGPPNVAYDNFSAAGREAQRLTRKDLARFVVLEAVVGYEPSSEPIDLIIEDIGMGPSSEHVKTTGPVGLDECCEHEGCNCNHGHPGPCPPEEGCSCSEPGGPNPDYCRADDDPVGLDCIDPDCDCEEGWARAVHHAAHLAHGEHKHQYYPGCCPSEPEETEPKPAPEPDYHAASGSGGPGCSCWWCDPDNHDVENCEFPHCGCKRFLEALEHDLADLIPIVNCPCGCADDEPTCDCHEHGECEVCRDSDAPEPEREWCAHCGFGLRVVED